MAPDAKEFPTEVAGSAVPSVASWKICNLDIPEVAGYAVPPGFDKLDTPEVAGYAVPPGFDKLDTPEVAGYAVPPGFDKLDTPEVAGYAVPPGFLCLFDILDVWILGVLDIGKNVWKRQMK